jgi:UDP-glucuronate 4-epimerase
MNYLITGVAGFIGMHVAQALLKQGKKVVGVDNLNNYYDSKLKLARLEQLKNFTNFEFVRADISSKEIINLIVNDICPQYVIHLAAQAGVRYSLDNPSAYIDSNLVGFSNILESCRRLSVKHLVYASSSSVYGGLKDLPFCESQKVDYPVSLYAATKKANELMAHTYSHLYGIPTTGLRFFTVYGPWGRPDMSPYLFTDAIINERPIKIFNYGDMKRDFTYIDDIVEGVCRTLNKPPVNGLASDSPINQSGTDYATPYKIFNIGNNCPVSLIHYIEVIENVIGKKVDKQLMPLQAGDVKETMADIEHLDQWVGFRPSVNLAEGIKSFVSWYREYHKV